MMRTTTMLLAGALGWSVWCAELRAEDDGQINGAVLIDQDLNQEAIGLLGLSDGYLRYFGSDRQLTRRSLDQVVALRMEGWEQAPGAAVIVAPEPEIATDLPPGVVIDGNMIVIDGNVRLRLGGIQAANVNINGRRIDMDAIHRALAMRELQAAMGDGERDETGAAEADTIGQIHLTDGQRMTGKMAGVIDGQTLRWRTDHATVAVSLDKIVWIGPMGRDARAAAPVSTDVIELTNGDHAAGLVESIDADGVTINLDEQSMRIDWPRVQSMRLINPERLAGGAWLWLNDGSRLLVGEPLITRERVTARWFGEHEVDLPRTTLREMRFTRQYELIRLADLSPTIRSGGVVFGVPMLPEHRGGKIFLHAPIEVAYALPKRASRFAATGSLEAADLNWADMDWTVGTGVGETARMRIHAEQPTATVNLPLGGRGRGGELTIGLETGRNGPVRDRLTLVDAMILVKRVDERASE
ncbi:MAG: hypothetical protein CMJ49_06970 [Planctomycetaceae bacterium]|nr:hypothetical protein [Planctomycetaceae bacterium]